METAIEARDLRYSDFSVPYLVDETLREGVERSPVPISLDEKCHLLKMMIDAGLRKFIVGCGPEEPTVWARLWQMKEKQEIPSDTEPTFIVLLNCWETAYNYFKNGKYPAEWIKNTVISFGMITYRESEKRF
ncbi:hypothetical protein [Telmatospirillum sp.]|uniref:hypothetical protein n=1 Tax=Telmatospirillum sp. TaxID=2079197 RepID=UPI00284704C5|nr:hypothetical protein [Telmatospirillum sp.]MDR3436561.1 hypothetical protein [Telmatospirillum sp.]